MNAPLAEKKYLLDVYKKTTIAVSCAAGKYLFDGVGRRYLDFFSGLSVCNFGHRHPKIVAAAKKQIGRYMHVSNLYHTDVQARLAETLVRMTFPGKVFFSNSGAEANECAIKIARKWGADRGRNAIITFRDSFHGRTIATLAATGQEKFRKGFGPMPGGFAHARFNDLSSVKKLLARRTAAVMIEPVQGEGGVNAAGKRFLSGLKELCRTAGALLIFDEIQTGMGRTGRAFAYQGYGVTPDIMTLAKAFGGGFPLGATVVSRKIAPVFSPGDHGSTFGGNPVSCAASLAALSLLDDKFLRRVRDTGDYFLSRLSALRKKYPALVKDVRGLGLMLGAELSSPGAPVVEECRRRGLLVNCTREKVLRFLPPLIVNRRDCDTAVSILDESLLAAK